MRSSRARDTSIFYAQRGILLLEPHFVKPRVQGASRPAARQNAKSHFIARAFAKVIAPNMPSSLNNTENLSIMVSPKTHDRGAAFISSPTTRGKTQGERGGCRRPAGASNSAGPGAQENILRTVAFGGELSWLGINTSIVCVEPCHRGSYFFERGNRWNS